MLNTKGACCYKNMKTCLTESAWYALPHKVDIFKITKLSLLQSFAKIFPWIIEAAPKPTDFSENRHVYSNRVIRSTLSNLSLYYHIVKVISFYFSEILQFKGAKCTADTVFDVAMMVATKLNEKADAIKRKRDIVLFDL